MYKYPAISLSEISKEVYISDLYPYYPSSNLTELPSDPNSLNSYKNTLLINLVF